MSEGESRGGKCKTKEAKESLTGKRKDTEPVSFTNGRLDTNDYQCATAMAASGNGQTVL